MPFSWGLRWNRGTWKKGNHWDKVRQSLAELCSSTLSEGRPWKQWDWYLAGEISKESTGGIAWFFPTSYSKTQKERDGLKTLLSKRVQDSQPLHVAKNEKAWPEENGKGMLKRFWVGLNLTGHLCRSQECRWDHMCKDIDRLNQRGDRKLDGAKEGLCYFLGSTGSDHTATQLLRCAVLQGEGTRTLSPLVQGTRLFPHWFYRVRLCLWFFCQNNPTQGLRNEATAVESWVDGTAPTPWRLGVDPLCRSLDQRRLFSNLKIEWHLLC